MRLWADAGVVDEHVEVPKVLGDGCDGGGDGGVGVGVELHKADAAWEGPGLDVLEDGLAFGEVSRADDDVVGWGGGCEVNNGVETDAVGCTWSC